MKSFTRYLTTISVTAVVSTVFAFTALGGPADAQPAAEQPTHAAPTAEKQVAPQPAPNPAGPGASSSGGTQSTTPPPPVQQADKGVASSPDVRDTTTSGPPEGSGAAGSAAPTAGAAAGSAAGSAAPAAAGSGAAPAPAAKAEIAWYDQLANKPIDEGGNFWMPKSVNVVTDSSDMMFITVLALSAFFFFAIAGAVIYFVIKYRHRPGHKAEPSAAHNDALEVTWTVIPTLITVFLFYYGWRGYIHIVTPPTKAVEIQVTAKRWAWNFKHSNGAEDADLHVPVGVPVRLVMTSQDVLHSFYVPVLRTKQDIVPRRYTYAWFEATKPGTYRLDCAEYCGTNHSQMGLQPATPEYPNGRRAVIVVHEPGGYERYLSDKASGGNMPPEQLGHMLYEKKGCTGCHTIDGSAKVGPSFLHDFGSKVPLSDGSTITMDENYIRESLMYPQAKARPGYPPSMPSFEGQLKEKDIQGIIAFIKSLK